VVEERTQRFCFVARCDGFQARLPRDLDHRAFARNGVRGTPASLRRGVEHVRDLSRDRSSRLRIR
jgi:hypothetical protein